MDQITPFLYLVTLPNVCVCDCSDQFQSVTWKKGGERGQNDFICIFLCGKNMKTFFHDYFSWLLWTLDSDRTPCTETFNDVAHTRSSKDYVISSSVKKK